MARDSVRAEENEALNLALRSLFRAFETQALPDSLRPDSNGNLLDQLQDAAPEADPA
jgi:hypothetical protein